MYTVRDPAEVPQLHHTVSFLGVTHGYLTPGCLTRIRSSHVVPEMEALGAGELMTSRRDERGRGTRGQDVRPGVDHHVEA